MEAVRNALLSPFTLALVGYVALVTVLSILIQPLRLRMVKLAEEMLAEDHWNEAERDKINDLLDTSMSFKVGLLMIAAAIGIIIDDILRRPLVSDEERAALRKDPRFQSFLHLYFISIMAINPIATAFFVPLVLIDALIEKCMGKRDVMVAMEEPVIRASAAMPNVRERCPEPA